MQDSGSHPRATLAATILGSSLAFIDGSVVNVALPALAQDLRASSASLTWTINAYLLPLGALILLGGGLGDHFGRRRFFLLGLLVFTAASVGCAGAPSLGWLIGCRGLQGVGAALLLPNSLAILGSAFSGEARGRAIGSWAAAGALTAAVGPVIGGWLVDSVGWRAIFLLNLPVAVGAAVLAVKYVAEPPRPRPAVGLDGVGAALATVALGLLTWSLSAASEQRAQLAGVSSAAVSGTVLLGVFVWYESRRGSDAIMPLAMFATPTFIGVTLLTFFLYGSLGGLLVLLPYLLIRIEHWSAIAAGAALLPIPVLIGSGSRLMGRVAARYGARWPLGLGAALVAVGLALYARIGGTILVYWSDVFPPTLVVALGMGACVAPLTTTVMSAVETERVGVASGFNSAVARIAGLIATALLGFVFVRQGSSESFLMGFRAAVLIGAASAAAAAICTFLLVDA
jgi:EmrB/QacA subfamily drug resistance transporter